MNGHFYFVHDSANPRFPAGATCWVGAVIRRVGPLAGSNAILIVRLVGSRAQTAPAGYVQSEAIAAKLSIPAAA
jgi:hypothetical protein